MGGGINRHLFQRIISPVNLFAAWREFRRGKKNRWDVQDFEFNLEDNIFELRRILTAKIYHPDPYVSFYIHDPKRRHIHKASVRDRVLHQAVFRVLYPIFDRRFIYDSYSSRVGKGVHAAVRRLEQFLIKTSANYRRPAYALKCDVHKFFDSIDHEILFALVRRMVPDSETLQLIERIIRSFERSPGKGLPLGNVTSQLFANIYLHELDFFVKHHLCEKFYIRYTDDFVIVGDRSDFVGVLQSLRTFLYDRLRLKLHPGKILIRSYSCGVDFLGYVLRPYHRVLRTKTKRRIFRKVNPTNLPSYLGVLSHANAYRISEKLKNKFKS